MIGAWLVLTVNGTSLVGPSAAVDVFGGSRYGGVSTFIGEERAFWRAEAC